MVFVDLESDRRNVYIDLFIKIINGEILMSFVKDIVKVGIGSAIGVSIAGKRIGAGMEKANIKAQGLQTGKINDYMGMYNSFFKVDEGTLLLDGDKIFFSGIKKIGRIPTGKSNYVEISLADVDDVCVEDLLPKKLVLTLKNGETYKFTNMEKLSVRKKSAYTLQEWMLFIKKASTEVRSEIIHNKEIVSTHKISKKTANDNHFCTECGQNLTISAKFCGSCGTKQ